MQESNTSSIPKFEKPKICLLSLSQAEMDVLKVDFEKVFHGSLGQPIKTKYYHDTYCKFILNYDFPDNIQEYDIFIMDYTNDQTIEYSSSDHERKNTKSSTEYFFVAEHPQKIFDPRNFARQFFFKSINKKKRKSVVIIFGGHEEKIHYIIRDFSNYRDEEAHEIATYENLGSIINIENKCGTEYSVEPSDFKKLLEKHSIGLNYNVIFEPDEYQFSRFDINFNPLMHNADGEIISFYLKGEGLDLIMLPDINDKALLLKELVSEILPDLYPDLFPFSDKNNWLNQEVYNLPNHKSLSKDLEKLEVDYLASKLQLNKRIDDNKKEFEYLHDLINATGDVLVNALIKYFNWLGIEQVVDKDQTSTILKEEDLQLIHQGNFIIIEAKGISGTSKDEDCSQIAKVRYRRIKELQRMDIQALYIVNHQRNKPPLSRDNPPFKPHQITDAEEDSRGLLTTWQLYQAYFNVIDGILTKEDIINQMSETGLINFKPLTLYINIGTPKEVHHKGEIIIIELKGCLINVGDEILVITNDNKFIALKILSINFNNNSVSSVSDGEVGVKINGKINKTNQLWLKKKK